MVSRSEPARKLLPETDDYPLPWPPRHWPFTANAAQAVAIHDPSPQRAARSFKPPFGKLELEIRPDGNLEGSVRSRGRTVGHTWAVRDLIEAGLNEPAGWFCAMGIVLLVQFWGGVCARGQTDERQRADSHLAHDWSSGTAKPVCFSGKWCCATARTGATKAWDRSPSLRPAWQQTVGWIYVACRGRS